MTTTTPRPPEGDWLGTPYLRFTREGPFGVCTLDRPEARNAMTPAMYFGIRDAVRHVDADPDLAGLLITGAGDVFAPGGDMGGGDGSDNWPTFGSALGMDVTPFETLRQSVKPVVSAVNGLCQGGGLQIALCSDMTVVSDRATFRVPELLRGIADTYYSQMLARLIGPVRARGQEPGQVQPGQLPRPVRSHRYAGRHLRPRGAGGLPVVQGAALAELGSPRSAHRRPPLVANSARGSTSTVDSRARFAGQ